MPKIEWKSAAIGAALMYGFVWWKLHKGAAATPAQ